MNYLAALTENAQADIRAMPAPVARYVLLQLHNLQENPTLLSKRSHFPFREKCQIFSFDYDWDGQRYFINVLFQFSADEQQLLISDVAWQAAKEWWDWGDDT